jgi:hypothetical protein
LGAANTFFLTVPVDPAPRDNSGGFAGIRGFGGLRDRGADGAIGLLGFDGMC